MHVTTCVQYTVAIGKRLDVQSNTINLPFGLQLKELQTFALSSWGKSWFPNTSTNLKKMALFSLMVKVFVTSFSM